MTTEQDKPGLSGLEKLAYENTHYLNNIRAKSGDVAWATEMGSFLARATSALGWMSRRELVAQIYIDMAEDIDVLYHNPNLSRAFVLGFLNSGKQIGSEYQLQHPEKLPIKTETGE